MAGEKPEPGGQVGKAEKGLRWFRNINLLGAGALLGASLLVPPLAAPLTAAGAFEVVHAGALEIGRRHVAKKRGKKHK